jgi:hypothetical protein
MSSTPVTLVSAAFGRFGDFEPGVGSAIADPNRKVWSVDFRGTFHGASCGGSSSVPQPCPPPNPTARVVVDSVSGTFIMARTPANAA